MLIIIVFYNFLFLLSPPCILSSILPSSRFIFLSFVISLPFCSCTSMSICTHSICSLSFCLLQSCFLLCYSCTSLVHLCSLFLLFLCVPIPPCPSLLTPPVPAGQGSLGNSANLSNSTSLDWLNNIDLLKESVKAASSYNWSDIDVSQFQGKHLPLFHKIKGARSDCFGFFSNFQRLWYQKKGHIFLITPGEFYS